MSTPEPTLPRTEAQIFALGWESGTAQCPPEISRKMQSLYRAPASAQIDHDDEPLDAA
jgi:hypothetical protein